MEPKMPFTDLVTSTFDFGWHRYFTVFKLMILPLLIYLIGLLILNGSVMQFLMDTSPEFDPATGMAFGSGQTFTQMAALGILWVGGLILSLPFISAAVRVFRLASLNEEPTLSDVFKFDRNVWLTVASYVLLYVLVTVASWAVLFVPSLIDLPINLVLNFYVKFFIGIAIYVFSIILQVKMIPFHAATASEGRIPLIETWQKTDGYFWTMFWAQALLLFMVVGAGFIFFKLVEFIQSVGGVAEALNPSFGILNLLILIGAIIAGFFFIFFAVGVIVSFPAIIYRHLWGAKAA